MNYPDTGTPEYSLTTSLKKTIHQMPDREDASPGPKYQLGSLSKANTFTVGKSHRTPINAGIEHTPSPQHYPNQAEATTHAMSIPQAKEQQGENEIPAPSWYQPGSELTKSKVLTYSMGQKYPSIMDDNNSNPGPGEYKTPRSMELLTRSKSMTDSKFSTARRFKQDRFSTPGVGQYKVSDGGMVPKKTTIPKAEAKPVTEVPPGPSDYRMISGFQNSSERQPGKSLSAKLGSSAFQGGDETGFAFIKYFANPEQTLVTRRSAEKYSFGKHERVLFQDDLNPGPTDYINDAIEAKHSVHVVIPESQRTEYNDTIDHPGPGAYQPRDPKGTGFTIGRSKSVAFLADHPGAGRYNLEAKTGKEGKGNSFGRGKRTSFVSTNLAGVGDYCMPAFKRSANSGFSRSDRFGKTDGGQPGPGDYHLHSTMGNKHQQKGK